MTSLQREVAALREEVARLKGQKGKPSIGPSQLNPRERKKDRGENPDKSGAERRIDRTVVVKAEGVPEGSRFKGYADFDVQELVIKAETTRYRVEKWLTPDGKLLTGKLPVAPGVDSGHFGATLQSFILYQYYHALVTEPVLLEQRREYGVHISGGQLHRLVTEGKERFHREKDEILRVGLRVSSWTVRDEDRSEAYEPEPRSGARRGRSGGMPERPVEHRTEEPVRDRPGAYAAVGRHLAQSN